MGKVKIDDKIVSLKLVYFGAPGVGKSTNLERLRNRTSDARPGDLITLDHDGDRTLMFDWLPIRGAAIGGFDVRLQVYAIPGRPKLESTKRRVLKDADGIVFVLDSGPDKLAENRTAWGELAEHLTALGTSRDKVPLVIQLNKRDLPNAMSGDDLRARLGMAGFPVIEAVANGAAGVGMTLLDIAKRAVKGLSDPVRGGGEALEASDIIRIESQALPEAFSACGLLPKRLRTTPSPVAQEVQVFSKHKSHDSPQQPSKDLPTQKLAAAKLVGAMSREVANSPAAPYLSGMHKAVGAPTPQTAFTPAPMGQAKPHVSPPHVATTVASPKAGDERPTVPPLPLPESGTAPRNARDAESEREVSSDDDRPPSEPPLTRDDVRAMIALSEARVLARLEQVHEEIAELRGLLMNVGEQVRRVSSAPPESEARVIRMVRDALGSMELTLKTK